MFLNKIRNIFCVPDTKFVSATMCARLLEPLHVFLRSWLVCIFSPFVFIQRLCFFYYVLNFFFLFGVLFRCSRYKLGVEVLFAQMYNKTWYVLESDTVFFIKCLCNCVAESFRQVQRFNAKTEPSGRRSYHSIVSVLFLFH